MKTSLEWSRLRGRGSSCDSHVAAISPPRTQQSLGGDACRRWAWIAGALGWLLLAGSGLLAADPTLSDFGYSAKAPGPSRPLLVVLVEFSNQGAIPGTIANWEDFIFAKGTTTNTLNAYYGEISLDRFTWTQGGVVKIALDGTNDLVHFNARMPANAGDHDGEINYMSNIVRQAMGVFDLQPYDTTGTRGLVTNGELEILLLSNEGYIGMTRWLSQVKPAGSTVAWSGNVTGGSANFTEGQLHISAHELAHALGTFDIYGDGVELNRGLSLMSGIGPLGHLDAWQKMLFGWCEPRIYPLWSSNQVTLPSTQMRAEYAPVILYDPYRGAGEFFILEYRSKTNSQVARHYEHDLPTNGLLIWHVAQDTRNHAPYEYVDVTCPEAEAGWRQCARCQELVPLADAAKPCLTSGEAHDLNASAKSDLRVVHDDLTFGGQSSWRRCSRCGGLFYGPNAATSSCPAGGGHTAGASPDYSLQMDLPMLMGRRPYYRCTLCESLFYWSGGSDPRGECPAQPGSGGHVADTTHVFVVLDGWGEPAVVSEAQIVWQGVHQFQRAGGTLWGSGQTTPLLRWFDGKSAPYALTVEPFVDGAPSVTVSWSGITITEQDVWVDFAYSGTQELGTFPKPFNTLGEAITAAPAGGNVNIFSGRTHAGARVTKSIHLRAYDGPVTIGR